MINDKIPNFLVIGKKLIHLTYIKNGGLTQGGISFGTPIENSVTFSADISSDISTEKGEVRIVDSEYNIFDVEIISTDASNLLFYGRYTFTGKADNPDQRKLIDEFVKNVKS